MNGTPNADFEIFDEKNYIILSLEGRGNDGRFCEDDWRCDANLVEVSYRIDEGDEWGAGCDEFISTADIKRMADCVRNVMYRQNDKDHYECRDDIARISLKFHKDSDTYMLAVSFIETLIRDHHITVTKNNLTKAGLEEYVNAFFAWEKKYPVIRPHGTDIDSDVDK